MLNDEVTTAALEVGKNVAEDLIRPTSKTIGDNLGLLVDGVMGWLGYWGKKQAIKREVCLTNYKQKIVEKVSNISDEKLQEPQIRIVGPAIEASKFYIEEEEFREMFAELIASACNTDYSNSVHPAFPEIIKQLSHIDVKILEVLSRTKTIPACEIHAISKNQTVSPCPHLLFDFKTENHFTQDDELLLTESVDNLSRLGVVCKNTRVIELGYDYEQFKEHWLYQAVSIVASPESEIRIIKYRIELTQLGEDFARCCFGKN